MLKVKAISSLEKVFLGDTGEQFSPLKQISAAIGERISFQIVIDTIPLETSHKYAQIDISVCDAFKNCATVDEVGYIPSEMPSYPDRFDDDFITERPGLFPDVLYPVKDGKTKTRRYHACVLFVTVDLDESIKAGRHELAVSITDLRDESLQTVSVMLDVYPVKMAANDLIFTQWFHCDSIADYHGVDMMSDEHWDLIEAYIKTAARTGITMLLTPLFTPPLDTAVGGERPTMQLVKVYCDNNKYSFDFSLLDHWVNLCKKYGIKYFEMSHLYTQWGAEFCPKIVVNVEGKEEKLFGWHVSAHGKEYKEFLAVFLPQLTEHLYQLGIAENCYFHISDEPSLKREHDFDNYKSAKEFLTPYFDGFKMIDALSNVEFYDKGLIEIPICATDHIGPFMERDVKERWCYYCCGQGDGVGNRFFAMPSYRNRILGVQMYVANMVGFLQWGYNFYYAAQAVKKINPYITSDGDQAWPSGDPYSVYPFENEAIESIRTKVFYDALQDRMLLKQLEEKIGRAAVLDLIYKTAGEKIDFSHYPRNDQFLLKLHDVVLQALAQ